MPMRETSPTPASQSLPRRRSLTSLGTVLDEMIRDLGLGEVVAKGAAVALWPEVVGEAVSRVTHPQTVRGSTLVVTVADSAWLQQLRYLEEPMVERLNAAIGRPVIDGIYLQIGSIPAAPDEDEPLEDAAGLDPEAAAHLEAVVAEVEDPALRATLRKVLACARRIEKEEGR
ncbi:MAG: DciA family protein [Candidatus Tectimicrobiota bacterium]